jgi:hypothetical protein
MNGSLGRNCPIQLAPIEAKQLYSRKLGLDSSKIGLIREPLVVVPFLLGHFKPTFVKEL